MLICLEIRSNSFIMYNSLGIGASNRKGKYISPTIDIATISVRNLGKLGTTLHVVDSGVRGFREDEYALFV